MARKKLGTHIGVVVDDYRLDPADPGLRDFVTELLLQHKAVFFKSQHLDRHTFMEVAKRLGRTEVHPFISEDEPVVHGISPFQPYHEYPEITGIYHDEKHTGNLNAWHSDLNWREVPTFGSILRAVQIPPRGGDTLWANMAAAYASLSDEVKEQLDGLRVVHDWMQIYFPAFDGNDEALSRMREKYPAQSHPLVLTHPFTGEKSLFSNKVSGVRIEGLEEAESRRILDMVHQLAWRPEFQCRFSWEEGDVAIWDNLASQHYAVSDYWPHVRKMERITLEGEPIK
ncbi:TauD/TfdA dioxygenase family protein [Streptomyces sp. NPDC059506]|uniref:TauD/TfdA family dioxygenase n=1 Tax=Streptomyces thermolineatus TaxID=44033 RepID=A0ABP5ZQZ1_9ACTN|nr:TauD/TfdA family dioxygenase [Streptomyces sp. HB2AG]MCZ2526166.1 TauD/TfdA family dioxygenase [Streptomyces sp. HB2AG]